MSKTILKAVARVQRLSSLSSPVSQRHRKVIAAKPPPPKDDDSEDDNQDQEVKEESQDLTDPDGNPVQTSPDMDPDGEPSEQDEDDDEQFTLEDVIKCFLRANPTPTDEQVHAFAGLMDMSYEEFESQVYKKFGEAVKQSTSIGPSEELDETDETSTDDSGDGPDLDLEDRELEADDELDVQDEIEMFVVAYMLYNPEPTDEQIHTLAFVVDITKEELEARIYRMLGSFLKVDDEALDDDEDDDEDASNEDSEEDLDEVDSESDDATEDDSVDESDD